MSFYYFYFIIIFIFIINYYRQRKQGKLNLWAIFDGNSFTRSILVYPKFLWRQSEECYISNITVYCFPVDLTIKEQRAALISRYDVHLVTL